MNAAFMLLGRCRIAVCPGQGAGRARKATPVTSALPAPFSRSAYVGHDDRTAAERPAGRTGTRLPLRQDAVDPGFHCVPADAAHPDRDADGADVSWVRFSGTCR